VAFGLCAALAWRYPRGRWLFLVFAVSAALQRVATSAHYPSDVCFGASLGFLGAALFLADGTSAADTRTD
jgi:membrane-associated phospholipid phosphatase